MSPDASDASATTPDAARPRPRFPTWPRATLHAATEGEAAALATVATALFGKWPLPGDLASIPTDSYTAAFTALYLGPAFERPVVAAATRRTALALEPRILGRYRKERGSFADWFHLNAEDLALQECMVEFQAGRAQAEVIALVWQHFFQRPGDGTEARPRLSPAEYWIRDVFARYDPDPDPDRLQEVADLFLEGKVLPGTFFRQFDVARGASFKQWLRTSLMNRARDYLQQAPAPNIITYSEEFARLLSDEGPTREAAVSRTARQERFLADVSARLVEPASGAEPSSLAQSELLRQPLWRRILPVVLADPLYQLLYKLTAGLALNLADGRWLAEERRRRWTAAAYAEAVCGIAPTSEPAEADGTRKPDDSEAPATAGDPDTSERRAPTAQENPAYRLTNRDLDAERQRLLAALAPVLAGIVARPASREAAQGVQLQMRDELAEPGTFARRQALAEKRGVALEPAELAALDLSAAAERLRARLAETEREALAPLARAIIACDEALRHDLNASDRERRHRQSGRLSRLELRLRHKEHQRDRLNAEGTAKGTQLADLDRQIAQIRRRMTELSNELGKTTGLKEAEIGYLLGRSTGAIAGLKYRMRHTLEDFLAGTLLDRRRQRALARVSDTAPFTAYEARLEGLAHFEAFPGTPASLRALATIAPGAAATTIARYRALLYWAESADARARGEREADHDDGAPGAPATPAERTGEAGDASGAPRATAERGEFARALTEERPADIAAELDTIRGDLLDRERVVAAGARRAALIEYERTALAFLRTKVLLYRLHEETLR